MKTLAPESDPLGHAISDYFCDKKAHDILVESDIAEEDIIPVAYLFRTENELPTLEKIALEHCHGKILDVGAAAGCHSLILQEKNKDITSLDISELCCRVMKDSGLKQVENCDFYQYTQKGYDTLLCLMNGIGISGTIGGLSSFLRKSHELLTPGGSIIFDSSDIEYLYYEEDGSKWINLNARYYGELIYRMHYKKISGKSFPWLFIDFETLAPIAEEYGFEAQLLAQGEHYDYLGKLRKI